MSLGPVAKSCSFLGVQMKTGGKLASESCALLTQQRIGKIQNKHNNSGKAYIFLKTA